MGSTRWASTSSAGKLEQPKAATTPTLSKERQLRDYCRTHNLCFYCREPYDATHAAKCTKIPKAQANALILNDLDIQLIEEVLTQLDIEDALAADFGTLSLNTIAGTDEGEVMRLRALVNNNVMLMLVDSGSSHCFVSSIFLQKVGIQPVLAPPKVVQVANGEVLISDQVVPQLAWWIQGHTFTCDMRVLHLEAYDCILGYDWLKQNNPIIHHGEHKTMEFCHNGAQVTIQGVQTSNLAIQELSVDKLLK